MAREHQAVDEHVDRVAGVGEDQRQRDPEDFENAPRDGSRGAAAETHEKTSSPETRHIPEKPLLLPPPVQRVVVL